MQTNTIICGDCLDVLKGMEDNSVDLVLADPPYGINYQSARRTDKESWKPKIANDKKPFVSWVYDAHRVLKHDGRLLCFYRWDVQNAFLSEIKTMGFEVKSQIIWDKVSHGMGDLKGGFAPQHESIIYATKGQFEFVSKRPKSIIQCMRVMPDKLLHPNEKPIELICKLLKPTSNPNDLILDPFCGSGTTCVAAEELGRRWIGIDILEEYCQIARKRIQQTKDKYALFEVKK